MVIRYCKHHKETTAGKTSIATRQVKLLFKVLEQKGVCLVDKGKCLTETVCQLCFKIKSVTKYTLATFIHLLAIGFIATEYNISQSIFLVSILK